MIGTIIQEKVNSILALRDLEAVALNTTIVTDGYFEGSKDGSSMYKRVVDNSQVDDGGSIIRGNGNVYELIHEGTIYVEQFGAIADGSIDTTVFLSPVYAGTDNFVAFDNAIAFAVDNKLKVASKQSGKFLIVTVPGRFDMYNIKGYINMSDINIILNANAWTYPVETELCNLLHSSTTSGNIYIDIQNIKFETAPHTLVNVIANSATPGSWVDGDATAYSEVRFIQSKTSSAVYYVKLINIHLKSVDRGIYLGTNLEHNFFEYDNIFFEDTLMGSSIINVGDGSSFSNIKATQPRGRSQLWHILYSINWLSMDALDTVLYDNIHATEGMGKTIKHYNQVTSQHLLDVRNITGEYYNPNDEITGIRKPDMSPAYTHNDNSNGTLYVFRCRVKVSGSRVLNEYNKFNVIRGITFDRCSETNIFDCSGGSLTLYSGGSSPQVMNVYNCQFDEDIYNEGYAFIGTGVMTLNINNTHFLNMNKSIMFQQIRSQPYIRNYNKCTFKQIAYAPTSNDWMYKDSAKTIESAGSELNFEACYFDIDRRALSGSSTNTKPVGVVGTYVVFSIKNSTMSVKYNVDDFVQGRDNFTKFEGNNIYLHNFKVNDDILNKELSATTLLYKPRSFNTLADITGVKHPLCLMDFNILGDTYRFTGGGTNATRMIWTSFITNRIYVYGDTVKTSINEYYLVTKVGSSSAVIEPVTSDPFEDNGWIWKKLSVANLVTSRSFRGAADNIVDSFAVLRNTTELLEGDTVRTKSYYGDNNGGGSDFIKVVDTGQIDNGGSICRSSDGVYELIPTNSISIEQFGVRDEAESTNETVQIQEFFDYFKTSPESLATSKSDVIYWANEIDLVDMKDDCSIVMPCLFKKTDTSAPDLITFKSDTKPVQNVYIKMNLNGNGENQSTYISIADESQPVFEYFGHDAPAGFSYPVGTAFHIGQTDNSSFYTDNCTINLTLSNFGGYGLYGIPVRGLKVESIVTDTVLMDTIKLIAPENAAREKLHTVIDYIHAKRSSSIFNLGAAVKSNWNYTAICSIGTAIGEDIWDSTLVDGAWELSIDDIKFINCGTNPSYKIVSGAGKYNSIFKVNQSEVYGIHFNSVYSYGGVYEFQLINGTINSLVLEDHDGVAVNITKSKINSLKIFTTNEVNPSNVILGTLLDSEINKIYVSNILVNAGTVLRPVSGTLVSYTFLVINSIVNSIKLHGYRCENLFAYSYLDIQINNVNFESNPEYLALHGQNNYSTIGGAFITSAGDASKIICLYSNFEDNVEYLDSNNAGYIRDVNVNLNAVITTDGTVGIKRTQGPFNLRAATSVFGTTLRMSGNIYEWVYKGTNYYKTTKPTSGTDGTIVNANVFQKKPTAQIGVALLVNNALGTPYNMANIDDQSQGVYTISAKIVMGFAVCRINTSVATGQPTVTGASIWTGMGDPWVADVEMYMHVRTYDGSNVYYYFTTPF